MKFTGKNIGRRHCRCRALPGAICWPICVYIINQLVPWPVTDGLEGRYLVAQIFFELVLWAEYEFTDSRMKPVRTDDEIEITYGAAFESDVKQTHAIGDIETGAPRVGPA